MDHTIPDEVLNRLPGRLGRFAADGRLVEAGADWNLLPGVRALQDVVGPDHLDAVLAALQRARTGVVSEFTAPLRGVAGALRWLLWPLVADCVDVFVLPQHPDPIIAHAVADGVDAGISLTDADGRFHYVNAAYGAIYGVRPSELVGRMFTDMLQESDRSPALTRHGEIIRGERSTTRQKFAIRVHAGPQQGQGRFIRASSVRLLLPHGVFRLTTIVDISELRQSERDLAESEARYQHIFDNTSEGIYLSSRDGRLLEVNAPLARMHRCRSKEQLIDAVQSIDRDWYARTGARDSLLARLERDGSVDGFEAEAYRVGTGERFWTSESTTAIHDASGRLLYYQGTVRDITEQHRERDLATQRGEILEMIVRDVDLTTILYEVVGAIERNHTRLTAAILRVHEGRFEVCAAPALDPDCIGAIDGCLLDAVGGPVTAAIREARPMLDEEFPDSGDAAPGQAAGTLAEPLLRAGYARVMAFPVRGQDGEVLGVLAVFAAQAAATTTGLGATLREMAQIVSLAFEQQRLLNRLQHQAYYDALTGLPNRTLFNDRLGQLMRESERNAETVAVMMLDLDEFKLVNDTLGHGVGDALLEQVARRLESCVRGGDTVARFGGDEFVILVSLDREERAGDIATRIIEALDPVILVEDRELQARPSIGISLFPDDGTTADQLVQAADTAMYSAKRAGKNRFRYFAESMNREISHQLRTTTELRTAIALEELVLYYQPIVACADAVTVGAEALLRWQHPQRGLMMPGQFLSVAEQSELIREIDRYVMAAAVRQIAAWHGVLGMRSVAINLSARALDDSAFAAEFADLLDAAALPAESVELEITESMVMRDFARAVAHLQELRERLPGLRIAVDDFGTGHASLEYVRHLPVDVLKIDRTFVADLDRQDDERERKTAAAIVRTIVELARNLDLETIAEGVETPAQACHLRELGCQRAQGYLFGHPVDADTFVKRHGHKREPVSDRG